MGNHASFTSGTSMESSFPRFRDLPAELRLKIWEYAHMQEQRIVLLHLHGYCRLWVRPDLQGEEDADEEDTDKEEETQRPKRLGSDGLCVTVCTRSYNCSCDHRRGVSPHTVPPPVLFSVCQESRRATRKGYSMYFDKEYGQQGRPVDPSRSLTEDLHDDTQDDDKKSPTSHAMKRGAFINPAVDSLAFKVQLASPSALENVHDFVTVAQHEMPNIRRVVFYISIALRPYRWYQHSTYRLWQEWGADGLWIPQWALPSFPQLTEVVLVISDSCWDKMLPLEWRQKMQALWHRALEEVRDRWPPEWEDRMPQLVFEKATEDD